MIFYELLWFCAPHQRGDPSPILPLSHVCRLWRGVAISNKRLWSYIPLSSPELAAVFLGRSAPIEVSVYIPQDDRIDLERRQAAIGVIIRRRARVRTLMHWVPGPPYWIPETKHIYQDFAESSTLETLGVSLIDLEQSTIARFSRCSNLRSLILNHIYGIRVLEPVRCTSVSSLHLYQVHIDVHCFQKLLLCVPALESLALIQSNFRRPHAPEYYEAAYQRLHDLASWLFTGACPYQDASTFGEPLPSEPA